jgi:circadian clock protein KaiB
MRRKKAKPLSHVVMRRIAKLWQLRLYVVDQSPKSMAAISNLRRICESHLKGRYSLKVIDLLKHPRLARGDQILATPTVVRRLPVPVRTIIGCLSDIDEVLVGLDLRVGDQTETAF